MTEPIAARLAAHRAALDGLLSQTAAEDSASRRALTEAQAAWAGPARGGDWGADWQRLQRRVDAGETTLARAFRGEDDDPASRLLLERSRARIATLAGSADRPDDVRDEADAAEAQWRALRSRAGG